MARSFCCEFHSPPRTGDAGTCSRLSRITRKGSQDENACQGRRVAAAAFHDWVLLPKAAEAGSGCACAAVDTRTQAPLTHPELPASIATIPEIPLELDALFEQEPIPALRKRRPVKPAQQADTTPPPPAEATGVSAIGELTSGEPYDVRRETEDSIAATERGINGLNRNLSGPEQKTAAQVREYIKQAREALGSGDVIGANTLAAKAKVLLGELSQ